MSNTPGSASEVTGAIDALRDSTRAAEESGRLASATAVAAEIDKLREPARAAQAQRYFQAMPGGYGYPDQFIGVTVPQVRAVVRRARDLEIGEIEQLAVSEIHEHRLAALQIVDAQARRAKTQKKARRTRRQLPLAAEQRTHQQLGSRRHLGSAGAGRLGRHQRPDPDSRARLER